MSVKNRCERTAKRGWIPLVFGLLATSGVLAAPTAAEPGQAKAPTVRAGQTLRADGVWDEMMRWLIQRLVEKMNCGAPSVPDDVPVAMMMVVDCYMVGGVADMTPDEAAEFVATIDEAQRLTKEAPESVSRDVQEKFLSALRSMRAEAVVKQ